MENVHTAAGPLQGHTSATPRQERYVVLRTEIEMLTDSVHNLECLLDRIRGHSEDRIEKPREQVAPPSPMSSLSQLLDNGPREIMEARDRMAMLVEEINQMLF